MHKLPRTSVKAVGASQGPLRNATEWHGLRERPPGGVREPAISVGGGYSAGVETNVTPLTDAERAWVREQLAATTRFVADYGSTRSMGMAAVEHAWASWLDRQNVDPEDPNPILNAVGVYFGQSLVDALDGFDWVSTQEDGGTDFAVYGLPGRADVLIYPAAVVATRYQNRDAWFLQSGHDEIVAEVEQLRNAPTG
jgi:Domain of unknown function (DUF3806)